MISFSGASVLVLIAMGFALGGIIGAIPCQLPNKVIALRFDEMSEPFAVLAWDRALLMADFDPELVTAAPSASRTYLRRRSVRADATASEPSRAGRSSRRTPC